MKNIKSSPINTTKHLEIETYHHEGSGVDVRVRIDYDLGKISLLNNDGKAKQWIFAEREIDYMDGWLNILDAIKYAIKQASEKLAAHQKEIGTREERLHHRMEEMVKDAMDTFGNESRLQRM